MYIEVERERERERERGLGVTITARKRPSKLMFTMKDLGHTLPGHLLVRQNQTLANSKCYYFLKKPYKPQR